MFRLTENIYMGVKNMGLQISIKNVKSIKELSLNIPLENGLYAVTGENATGKSTIAMCAASLFYHFDTQQYLGRLTDSSSISFELTGQKQVCTYKSNGNVTKQGHINIKGFFEGSLIYGNRFRNTSFNTVKKLNAILDSDIEPADNFIRENLGLLLCNDKTFYHDLFWLKRGLHNKYHLGGTAFFYMRDGLRIHQAHMSTGENLLLSILHSLKMRIDDRGDKTTPCVIFLDEIELALHASSLRRLVIFLKDIANKYNMAIYFFTHSIELIRDIIPEHIFYIQKFVDGSIEVLNPCYPAFATKNLYDSNLGYDDVILVEDDLARVIIHNILRDHSLLNSRLVNVLPCGGWQNVLRLANDIMQSNLLGANSKIIVILDGDIQAKVQPFLLTNNINLNTPLNFLPVPSLEKYLKANLYDRVDKALTQELDNYVFQKVGLRNILLEYKNNGPYPKGDSNGKALFDALSVELASNGKSREELVNIVFRFINEHDSQRTNKILSFLQKQL